MRDINQCHFEDIIQERAISLNCGYPLCPKQLDKYGTKLSILNPNLITLILGRIPSQKYAISLASKKVFDITERKNFCSGQCYKASNYIKNQMLTSPLWLRDQEDIPEFRLLSSQSEAKKPSTSKPPPTTGGMVVDLAGINTDDLKIVERTYPKEEGCAIREGSEVVFKQDTASLTTSDGKKKEEEEQSELEVGLSKLSVRDD